MAGIAPPTLVERGELGTKGGTSIAQTPSANKPMRCLIEFTTANNGGTIDGDHDLIPIRFGACFGVIAGGLGGLAGPTGQRPNAGATRTLAKRFILTVWVGFDRRRPY